MSSCRACHRSLRMAFEPVFNSVSPGFFDSLDIRVMRGRDFAWSDHAVVLAWSFWDVLSPADYFRNWIRSASTDWDAAL